ncbi:serine hydrolase domain-containing protein [Chitinophagaceae bacterium LWZ2-11]
MGKIILLYLTIAFAFIFGCYGQSPPVKKPETSASSNPLITALDKKIDAKVRHFIASRKGVGLAIGILEKNKTVFYGYGETKRGNKQLPNDHTIFEIGSITKTFTATLLAYAANDGKLKLDDPVNKYLPDSIPPIEYQGIPVTLKMLSNHSSGLPELPTNFQFADEKNPHAGDPFKDYDNNDLFSFYKHFKLQRKPGVKFEYSNVAAATNGVILEKIYKKSYEELVVNQICNPLGMAETRQVVPDKDSSRIATGYDPTGTIVPPWNWKALSGAGGLRSTTSDLLKYARANMDTTPSALNRAMMLTHQATFKMKEGAMGLGWGIFKSDSYDYLTHTGGTGGFSSFILINLKSRIAIVILSNKVVDNLDNLGSDILELVENK